MDKESKLEKIINSIIKVIFVCIIIFLFVCSIFSSATMKKDEHTTYKQDNVIIQIGCITVACAIVTFLRAKKVKIKISKKHIIIAIVIWIIICTVWIFATKLQPRADQSKILDAAIQMKNGDFSTFKTGGYLYKNPHQLGLLLYFYLFELIFNNNAYIALQIMNILAILVAYYSVFRIVEYMYKNKNVSKLTIVGLFLFIPISMYITFIYGNLLGFALSMLALLFEFKYLEDEKNKDIIFMAIFISIAILFKSNYMITMIAMIILLIMEAIFKKKCKLIIPIVAIVICYLLSGITTKQVIKLISKEEVNKGTPMTSYVAMGLQEGEMAPRMV